VSPFVHLLRDDSITSLSPPPELNEIFPLKTYKDPGPSLPFTDESGLLTDPTRPLVFYMYSGIAMIYLYKDTTPGMESVRIDNH